MANLVRIEEVHLYMGWSDNVADTYAAKKLLDAANVKYVQLAYHDETQYQSIFDSLSTWTFGEGAATYQKVFKDFPFVHWVEVYDDYNKYIQCAYGLAEIKASKLFTPGVVFI